MSILVFNAGSSSLKFGLFDRAACRPLASGGIDWAGGDRQRAKLALDGPQGPLLRAVVAVPDDRRAAICAIEALAATGPTPGEPWPVIVAVGHRVVHGGAEFPDSAAIDSSVLESIRQLFPMAPLHNPPAWATIERPGGLPTAVQVAVFDTAFYAALPPGRTFIRCPTLVHRMGYSAVRLSRYQPEILRGQGGGDAGPILGRAADYQLPSRRGLFGGGGAGGPAHGHHHGVHASGRADDGHAVRLGRPGHSDHLQRRTWTEQRGD